MPSSSWPGWQGVAGSTQRVMRRPGIYIHCSLLPFKSRVSHNPGLPEEKGISELYVYFLVGLSWVLDSMRRCISHIKFLLSQKQGRWLKSHSTLSTVRGSSPLSRRQSLELPQEVPVPPAAPGKSKKPQRLHHTLFGIHGGRRHSPLSPEVSRCHGEVG